MKDVVQGYLRAHLDLIEQLHRHPGPMLDLAARLTRTLSSGGRVFAFGNGGSAADAQHFCAELVGGFRLKNAHRAAVSLVADAAVLTALGNDYGYDEIFAVQLRALAAPGDLALGLTTSGRSPNVLRGLETARELGAQTVCLCGNHTELVGPLADLVLSIPADETSLIQEAHGIVLHLCALLVERAEQERCR
ncbi:phosphoheptose isomerase [Geothermobacter ehrlichii]|uniref:Phosphoheptose isomerase n=1 Tax=Geothermobacter ehrlichii TaxID=213224 RepID=A0A5D3WNA8_9BACT|nr:SIS domain-containing protein [Geothermobacter ehrlichii]TYP00058.1 phosphoheptose isomerase [Geothermobacter ehrlichii]